MLILHFQYNRFPLCVTISVLILETIYVWVSLINFAGKPKYYCLKIADIILRHNFIVDMFVLSILICIDILCHIHRIPSVKSLWICVERVSRNKKCVPLFSILHFLKEGWLSNGNNHGNQFKQYIVMSSLSHSKYTQCIMRGCVQREVIYHKKFVFLFTQIVNALKLKQLTLKAWVHNSFFAFSNYGSFVDIKMISCMQFGSASKRRQRTRPGCAFM